MHEYNIILLVGFLSLSIALLLFTISYLLTTKQYDMEKTSPYECGFEPFTDTREPITIHFYLVALLYMIFDIEIIFLYPWAITLSQLGIYGIVVMLLFLIILTIGFLYEWFIGALEW